MKDLATYVLQKNMWRNTSKHNLLVLTNTQDRKTIAEMIDCDLSPENLCCDGEAPLSYVRRQGAFLRKCAAQLKKMDPSITFSEV
jgi:hypothetical protein